MNVRRLNRRPRAVIMTGVMVLATMVGLVTPAGAADITSPGPLTTIGVTPELRCSANHVGDTSGEFFGGTSCGTFLSIDSALYGWLGTGFTPVSQTGPTGSGTNADPFKIVTVVDAGTTGVRATQTDTYTTGLESFRTDVRVDNTSGSSKTVRAYRAADCYLQNSDQGYGVADTANGAIACTTGLASGSRIEQWFPITAGSHYYEDNYSSVYSRVSQQLAFPDSCTCSTFQDNGAGLSWDATIAASGTKTFSSFITFSPLGIVPLSMSLTADAASVPVNTNAGFTITVTNPNTTAVTLSSISDTLPATFSYVSGSSSGLTSANPAQGAGNVLTWNGPLTVPGSGSATLHYSANVGGTTGNFTSSASATNDSGYTIAPTGPDGAETVTNGTVTPLSLGLAPLSTNAAVGTDHTFTATAARGSAPQGGAPVAFYVVSGPAAGTGGLVTTDSAGHASFVVHGVTAGTDVVRAYVADGNVLVVSNDASVTWTPVASNGVTVTGTSNPVFITAGSAAQVHFTIANPGPVSAEGVAAAVDLPVGVTPTSLKVSQGGCGAFTNGHALCLIGAIAPGASVGLDVVIQTPAASAVSTIAVVATVSSAGHPNVSGTAGPVAVPAAPGQAVGYVPPGGTISTGTTATPTNTTVASFTLPNAGPGSLIELRSETTGVATFCAGQQCSGKILFLSPFEGYRNPRSPAKLKITWDKTVAGAGLNSKLYVQKAPGGPVTVVPTCGDTSHHIAIPSPCIHEKTLFGSGDVQFEILLLSGDPRFARR